MGGSIRDKGVGMDKLGADIREVMPKIKVRNEVY
jgi:hypothetical protein